MTDTRIPVPTAPVAPGPASTGPVSTAPVTEERAAEVAAAPAPPAAAATPAGSGWRPGRPSATALVVIVLVAVAGVLAVLAAWRLPPFVTPYESTDNAYVRGRTTVISPQVSGYVTAVLVRDFADVKAGEPLVRIDDRIYRQRVEQAQAQVDAQGATLANAAQSERSREASLAAQDAAVANAAAQLMRAQADMNRVNDLVTDGSVSLRERDQTLAALRQAQAGVRQANAAREIARQDVRTVIVGRGGQVAGVSGAEAARRLAQIDLANTIVRAPESGRLSEVGVRLGQYVTAVLVRDFATVLAGEPLVRIDDRIYRQRVEQAQAQLDAQGATLANAAQSERSRAAALAAQDAVVANAAAQLMRAQADMNRVNDLVTDGSVSLRERDQTLAALRQAQAGVRQANAAREIARQDVRTVIVGRGGQEAGVSGAEAARRLAQIDLANTIIRAPETGRLSEVGVRLGQYVTAGSQLMFLVPPETWVIANFKEAQTARMAVGQPASFTVDGLADARLTGRVERLSPAAGSEFAVLKPDNATGNFTKVPQRIAVRIRIDPGQRLIDRLRPGMSVQARVDTSGGPRVK